VAIRIRPDERSTSTGQNAEMERSIAISAERVGSVGLYSSVVTTAPGARTRIHHHGECETSIWIASGRARYTFGPSGLEETLELLSDPRAMRRIRKAEAEIAAGTAAELTKEQALALVRRR